jgi:hypothetical protein
MPDTDRPADAAIRPVLPSRASQSAETFMEQRPAFLDQPSPGTVLPALTKRTKPRRKKTERLPAPEIKLITRNRKKAMKKVKTFVALQGAPKRKRKVKLPSRKARINPNRPLELKNQLHAVIGAMVALEGGERASFASVLKLLEGHSKVGRKRVLDALAQVYA